MKFLFSPRAVSGLTSALLFVAPALSDAAITECVVSKQTPQLNAGRVKGSLRVMTAAQISL